jgi:hypothetical protein
MKKKWTWYHVSSSETGYTRTEVCSKAAVIRRIRKELKAGLHGAWAYLVDQDGRKAVVSIETKVNDELIFN